MACSSLERRNIWKVGLKQRNVQKVSLDGGKVLVGVSGIAQMGYYGFVAGEKQVSCMSTSTYVVVGVECIRDAGV